MSLTMRQPAPPLDVALAGGGRFNLSEANPGNFTLVIFYRGLHCQRCKGFLGEIETLLPEFTKRGVDVIAVSSDPEDRAEQSRSEWKLQNLKVGYGFAIDIARRWGLFISRGVRDDEPPIFIEPAIFLVDAKGLLTFAVINSITRMRPYPQDILDTIDRILEVPDLARGDA